MSVTKWSVVKISFIQLWHVVSLKDGVVQQIIMLKYDQWHICKLLYYRITQNFLALN